MYVRGSIPEALSCSMASRWRVAACCCPMQMAMTNADQMTAFSSERRLN
jgi:hypothetical protein